MITALHLKGCELLVYAVVFGYSQKGAGCYFGSAAALAETLGVSRQTIVSTFKSLTERGLLIKTDDYHAGVHTCAYAVNLDLSNNFTGCQETLQGCKEILQGGSQKTLHNNKSIDNKIDNIIPPYNTPQFIEVWKTLCRQPKWKGKSLDALQAQMDFLAAYPERDAIKMMQNSIRNGWQGIFPLKGDSATQSQYDLLCRKVGNVHASVFRQGQGMGWTREDYLQKCGENYAKEWDEYQDIIQAL